MEALTKIVQVLFAAFFIYTVVYLFQMGLSLCISVYALASQKEKKEVCQRVFTDEIASQTPVSVIIPAYNESACISKTIDLLAEDYPNLEIIAVDDGSDDNTEQYVTEHYGLSEAVIDFEPELKTKPVLRCYQKEFGDKKITLICKENGGKADALNCGLNISRNKLCVMLDADTEVKRGSIRIMANRFMMDKRTIVCAGAVGSEELANYPKLGFLRRLLVVFQTLEYYRTFYMQRIMFDKINANIIVSGAFAMFDSELVKKAGGYQIKTIGEDMELTMRLHAFCSSQKRKYRITYAPEAKCVTQLPFTYRDFYHQRRRWHIGMMQSKKLHTYMVGNGHYGWAGIMSGTFFTWYELFAPFLEVIGVLTLVAANVLGILDLAFTIKAVALYAAIVIAVQMVLAAAIDQYGIERISPKHRLSLFLVSLFETVFFHPLNTYIKIAATLTSYRNKRSWKHIERIKTEE